jgi:gluconate kinase
MGIKNYLIEGISGVGKTAVAEELERRGFHVIHGDRVLGHVGDPETGQALKRPSHHSDAESVAWLNKHWIWPVDQVKALIADHTNPITFFCGTSRNTKQFINLFDQVFVLDIDRATLMQRLSNRPEDEFGGRAVEKELIAKLHATQEDIPKTATHINAARSVSAVVDEIVMMCTALEKGQR